MENRILLQRIKETASKEYHLGSHKLNLAHLLVVVVGFAVFFMIFPKSESKEDKQVLVKSKSVCDEILRNEKLDPVKKFEGKPAPVNFSKFPEAKTYYSVITGGATLGPNYAGHFTFISWGCGTSYFSYAIVDSITGDIVAYPGYCTEFIALPSYNIDNRLLVFNPKDSLTKLEGRNIKDLISDFGYLAGSEREYFLIKENIDGHVRLDKICSENVLDGLYREEK